MANEIGITFAISEIVDIFEKYKLSKAEITRLCGSILLTITEGVEEKSTGDFANDTSKPV